MEAIQPFYCGLRLPHFFLFFSVIYALAHKMFRNWDPKYRYDACSCFLSLFHGTPSFVSALFAMFIIKDPQNSETPFGFGSQNSAFQNLVLEFSTSYFIMDLLHYFVFKPHDVLFIAHHLATLFVLLTCRFLVNHGAFAILVILVLAEITSPVQNVWSLARLRKNDVPMAAKLYNFLSPGFYILYTVARGVLAPAYVVKLGCAYASGAADGVIPGWLWGSWLLVTLSGILASLLWVFNHSVVLCKEMSCNKPKLM